MKKILLSTGFLFFSAPSMKSPYFTIASLNLQRFDTMYTNQLSGAQSKAPNVIIDQNWIILGRDYLMHHLFDIVCFQELPNQDAQFLSFEQALSIQYDFIKAGKAYGSLQLGIAYDKAKFKKIQNIPFQAFTQLDGSPLKDIAAKAQVIQNGFIGIVLENNSSKEKIGVICTHFKGGPVDDNIRKIMVQNIINKINSLKSSDKWIICGDFNKEYGTILTALATIDPARSWKIATPTNTNTEYDKSASRVIDGIFYTSATIPAPTSNGVTPQNKSEWQSYTYPKITTLSNPQPWFSDHAAIWAAFPLAVFTPPIDTTSTPSDSIDLKKMALLQDATSLAAPYVASMPPINPTEETKWTVTLLGKKDTLTITFIPQAKILQSQKEKIGQINYDTKTMHSTITILAINNAINYNHSGMSTPTPASNTSTVKPAHIGLGLALYNAMLTKYKTLKIVPPPVPITKLAESLQELHAASIPTPVVQPVDVAVKDLNPIVISPETIQLLQSLKNIQVTKAGGETKVLIPTILGQTNVQVLFTPNSPSEVVGNVFNNNVEASIKKSGKKIYMEAGHNQLGADSQKILDLGLAIFEYLRTNKPLPTGTSTGHIPAASSFKEAPLYDVSLHSLAHPGITIKLQIIDIVNSNADAIVNAANANCLGGGGIDGAITSASEGDGSTAEGKAVAAARAALPGGDGNRCPEGQARVTISGLLKPNNDIKYIIQATAPNCGNVQKKIIGTPLEKIFANLYFNILNTAYLVNNTTPHQGLLTINDPAIKYTVADEGKITSIAIPSMGTGVFACNFAEASTIAVRETMTFLHTHKHTDLKEIRFVFWQPGTTKGSGIEWTNCIGFVSIYKSHLHAAGFN